jgi:hypothetical protein
MRNLASWAQHIRHTAFLPVLWCNDACYRALLHTSRQTPADPNPQIPSSWHRTLDNFKQRLNRQTEIFFCIAEIDQQNGYRQARYERNFLVVNIESYFHNLTAINPGFTDLLNTYQHLNKLPGFFAYVKDAIISLIISHFAGFYFDADIKHTRQPFPQNYMALNPQHPVFTQVTDKHLPNAMLIQMSKVINDSSNPDEALLNCKVGAVPEAGIMETMLLCQMLASSYACIQANIIPILTHHSSPITNAKYLHHVRSGI